MIDGATDPDLHDAEKEKANKNAAKKRRTNVRRFPNFLILRNQLHDFRGSHLS